jgi:hypothetical protein
MIGWTSPGAYISPYYEMTQEKEKWGKELKDKIQLKKITLPPNCQPLQCNPLRLIINDLHYDHRACILSCYGLELILLGTLIL